AALAFDCAGRKGKLRNLEDELAAVQRALGKDLPLFGCYCAGEIGPLDVSQKKPGVLSGGGGWHVMVTVIGQ
ncbi:MAG: FIST C-terminal domain-containing protein, partial [Planctomycetota bacterium]